MTCSQNAWTRDVTNCWSGFGTCSPGTSIEPTLPIWRVAEGLLHSAYLGGRLDASTVVFAVAYTGLRGRRFVQWANAWDFAWAARTSRDDSVRLSTRVGMDALSANLVEVVQSLLFAAL
jgi:hypothetical protein